jgi:hypothetical protein
MPLSHSQILERNESPLILGRGGGMNFGIWHWGLKWTDFTNP